MKVLVPIDDMPYSFAALESILQRDWPEDTQFSLCRVIENNQARLSPTKLHNPEEHKLNLCHESEHYERAALKWLDGIADVFQKTGRRVETKILSGNIIKAVCE